MLAALIHRIIKNQKNGEITFLSMRSEKVTAIIITARKITAKIFGFFFKIIPPYMKEQER